MALGGVVDVNKDVAQVATSIDACFDTPDNGWRGNDVSRGQWPMPDAGPSNPSGTAPSKPNGIEDEAARRFSGEL